MKTLLVVFLLAALILDAAAEPCARAAKLPAPESAAPALEPSLPPAWVDPNLEGKTVKVYFRDGRLYEGKLVELTDEALRLKMGKRVETIPLTEVARVERAKSNRKWLAIAVVVGTLAVVGAIVGAAVTGEGD